jgi:hypothetical protein
MIVMIIILTACVVALGLSHFRTQRRCTKLFRLVYNLASCGVDLRERVDALDDWSRWLQDFSSETSGRCLALQAELEKFATLHELSRQILADFQRRLERLTPPHPWRTPEEEAALDACAQHTSPTEENLKSIKEAIRAVADSRAYLAWAKDTRGCTADGTLYGPKRARDEDKNRSHTGTTRRHDKRKKDQRG